jgi:hypothetical protein
LGSKHHLDDVDAAVSSLPHGDRFLSVDSRLQAHHGDMVAMSEEIRGDATPSNLKATLYGKQDEYTRARTDRNLEYSPAQHPSYPSHMQSALHASLAPDCTLVLGTRMWTMYKEVFKKDPARHRALFRVEDFRFARCLLESDGWADATMINFVTRTSAHPSPPLKGLQKSS